MTNRNHLYALCERIEDNKNNRLDREFVPVTPRTQSPVCFHKGGLSSKEEYFKTRKALGELGFLNNSRFGKRRRFEEFV